MNLKKSFFERCVDFVDNLNRNQSKSYGNTKEQNMFLNLFIVRFVIKSSFLIFLFLKT